MRALILRDEGKLDEAIAAFERVIAARPGDYRVYPEFANIDLRQHRAKDAEALYRRLRLLRGPQ